MVGGEDCLFNPAEAFVFGGAVLLHDAGMTLSAYPRRLDDLRDTVEWRDIVASLLQQSGVESPTESLIREPPEELVAQAVPEVLRIRHALHAERLATMSWPMPGANTEEHLIDDVDLREFYGPTIGIIARSHWLPISSLESALPKTIGAIGKAPTDWVVDPLKLACLLRTADAVHVDERRAPRFLRTLLTHLRQLGRVSGSESRRFPSLNFSN